MLVRLSAISVTCFVSCLVLALALVLNQAHAQTETSGNDDEARVHFRLGTAYYESGRFDQAAQEFQQAYDLSRRPQLLYNLFLAYRDAGEIAPAAECLRKFLAEAPNVEDREKLEARLASLEKILAEQQEKREQQQVAQPGRVTENGTAESSEQPKVPVPELNKKERLTWLPWTLLGTGGALVVSGVVTGALAAADESKLQNKCPSDGKCSLTSAQVDALVAKGSTKAAVGDALWVTGAVTAGLGAVFAFWQPWNNTSKTGERPRTALNFTCGFTGCRGGVTRHF